MNYLRRREAVEVGRRGVRVRADILGVDIVAYLELRQLLGDRYRVERVAGRAEDGRDLLVAVLERLDRVGAVVEDDPREGVVDAVIDIVAGLAVADGLADDLGDERRRHWPP